MILTDHARMMRGCSHERVWTFEQEELDRETRTDERVCWECVDLAARTPPGPTQPPTPPNHRPVG